ncbi:hypothetical protein FO519_008251 [Halicephalobus sp. NKZ332]|nr:hypothetical protein FO519_008251 [Halicephalobus sp. NKZ332]
MAVWPIVALLSFIGLSSVNAIWIGEEFWTTIHYNGDIERGRSQADFIHFNNVRDYDPVEEYVAYLIVNDNKGHYEIYGEAYIDNGRVCASFIQREGHSERICGGFRVLSRGKHDGENPFEWHATSRVDRPRAVEYLSHEIARIYSKQKVASIFGGVDLDHGTAYGVDPNGTVIRLTRHSDPAFYDENVEVLTVRRGYEPPQSYGRYPENYRQPVYNPPALPKPVDLDHLPRIYHSEQVDHQNIPDAETWYRNHPHYQQKPYDERHPHHHSQHQPAAYDPYDRNRDGHLDEHEIRARDDHLRRLQKEAEERQARQDEADAEESK